MSNSSQVEVTGRQQSNDSRSRRGSKEGGTVNQLGNGVAAEDVAGSAFRTGRSRIRDGSGIERTVQSVRDTGNGEIDIIRPTEGNVNMECYGSMLVAGGRNPAFGSNAFTYNVVRDDVPIIDTSRAVRPDRTPVAASGDGAHLVLAHAVLRGRTAEDERPRRWQGPRTTAHILVAMTLVLVLYTCSANGSPAARDAHGIRSSKDIDVDSLGYNISNMTDDDWGELFTNDVFGRTGKYHLRGKSNERGPRRLSTDCTAITHNRLYEQQKINNQWTNTGNPPARNRVMEFGNVDRVWKDADPVDRSVGMEVDDIHVYEHRRSWVTFSDERIVQLFQLNSPTGMVNAWAYVHAVPPQNADWTVFCKQGSMTLE